nr:MAG TPA: hypothetical protein [Caudoviricetes sp.]
MPCSIFNFLCFLIYLIKHIRRFRNCLHNSFY